MGNMEELQDIKQMIMTAKNCNNDLAVEHIAELVGRSKHTVYEWLSKRRQEIPDHMLELLKLKLIS